MSKIVYKKYSVYSKDLSTLFLVLFWLVLGFIVCFFGITKTFAAEQKTGLGFLNNSSVYISNNKGADIQLTRQTANNVNMDIKSIVFISNYNFQANTVYDYEIQITGQYLRNIDKATILSNNGICTLIGLSGLGEEYTQVRFTCSSATSSITIGLSNSNDNNITNGYNINWQSIYLWSITDTIDLGPIINNQSQNTQDILNNNNQNTQDIIDSNKETQDVIKDQFNSCKPSVNLFNENLASNISNYIVSLGSNYNALPIQLDPNTQYTISTSVDNTVLSDSSFVLMFRTYDSPNYNLFILNSETSLPNITSRSLTFTTGNNGILYLVNRYATNAKLTEYFKSVNVQIEKGSIATKYGPYGGQVCYNKLDEQNDKLNDLNNSLNNSNSSGATNDASNFFSNFTTDTFGLTSIITAPLSLINSITSSSCSTLRLPLPYLENKYLELPCMNTIYTKYFGSFFNIYQTITFGIVAYWVIVRIFNQVKDFKNPDHDEIEVLDL